MIQVFDFVPINPITGAHASKADTRKAKWFMVHSFLDAALRLRLTCLGARNREACLFWNGDLENAATQRRNPSG